MFTPNSVANRYLKCNSVLRVPPAVAKRYLDSMDIRSIRLSNLRKLVTEYGLGDLAGRASTSEKTLQQILARTPLTSGNPRAVGHALARKLEAGTGRALGWMDIFHDADLPVEASRLIERIRNDVVSGRLGVEQVSAIYEVVRNMNEAHE